MKVTVQLFAVLREMAGVQQIELDELPEDLDLAGLKRLLAERHPELGEVSAARGVIDTVYVGEEAAIRDGAKVALIPPVSGGAPLPGEEFECGVFELTAEVLDPAECQRRVSHPSCGAVCLFTGTVRADAEGRAVERLHYEAFQEMAGPEMGRIFGRCQAELGDVDGTRPDLRLRMLCQHRTGEVEVGEASVVVAVASPHRDAAFKACRFLIDEIKVSLPVWKKELYPDGGHWVGQGS